MTLVTQIYPQESEDKYFDHHHPQPNSRFADYFLFINFMFALTDKSYRSLSEGDLGYIYPLPSHQDNEIPGLSQISILMLMLVNE